MKTKTFKLTTLTLWSLYFYLLSFPVMGQAPDSFKYQAVLRDNGGTIIANQAVDVRITISNSSIAVYQENHTTTTNLYGLVNLNVGTGTVLSGVFANISWGNDTHFIQVEVNTGGGYVNMGTTQLLSVPYALHAKTADIVSETDPVFIASPSFGITGASITNWNTAYGWGNHATAGYLTGETDPVFTASPSFGISGSNITNWNTAYGWGNHATAGYLTGETDPVFTASPSFGITGSNITNWNSAFGWGNHATAGYLTGNQSITLSGDVTGSGTTAVTTTIANNAVTTAKIANNAVTVAKLPSGATASTFLRGDGTWATPPTGGSSNWSVNGNNIFSNNTGNVGIGTTAPNAKLHINGDGTTIAFRVQNSGQSKLLVGTNGGVAIGSNQTTLPENGLFVVGNVGIGTYDPNARLEISGSGEQSLRIHSSSTPGDVSIDFLRAGTSFYDWKIRNTGGDIRFSWSADDLVTVNDVFCMKHSTGRIGIGTNTPTAQLHTTGTLRFEGAGTPGTGKVLTSDAQGNATWEPLRYQVGDFAYGGVVIYVEPCGTKGLVCAIENRAAIEWGTSYTLNATAEGMYGGKINTTIIVSVYAAHSEFFQIAARSGMNYNYGGYGDWYLPAKDELNLIHQNYLTINAVSIANGGEAIHSNELYWSSTEYDNGMAWVQRLTSTGAQYATPKSMIRNIRPVRAF